MVVTISTAIVIESNNDNDSNILRRLHSDHMKDCAIASQITIVMEDTTMIHETIIIKLIRIMRQRQQHSPMDTSNDSSRINTICSSSRIRKKNIMNNRNDGSFGLRNEILISIIRMNSKTIIHYLRFPSKVMVRYQFWILRAQYGMLRIISCTLIKKKIHHAMDIHVGNSKSIGLIEL